MTVSFDPLDRPVSVSARRHRPLRDLERKLWTICGSGMCGCLVVAIGMIAWRMA